MTSAEALGRSRLGDFLRRERVSIGYTQPELAKIMKTSAARIQKYESGVTIPDTLRMYRLSNELGFLVDDAMEAAFGGSLDA